MCIGVGGSPGESCLALAILKHTLGFVQSVDDPWKIFFVVIALCKCVCTCTHLCVYMGIHATAHVQVREQLGSQ